MDEKDPLPDVTVIAETAHVTAAAGVPGEGQVITTAATAATDAITRSARDVRAGEQAIESASALEAQGRRDAAAITLAGQQSVNSRWEKTQSWIALYSSSIVVSVFAAIAIVITWSLVATSAVGAEASVRVALLTSVLGGLSNVLFLVVGFYFGRTNHQRMGGVGPAEVGR